MVRPDLVDAQTYEAMERDLKDLRRQAFWQEVVEARDEYRRGESRMYEDADDLIADLGLPTGADSSTTS